MRGMQGWSLVILIACSAPPRAISNTNTANAGVVRRTTPCGFTELAALDREAWTIATGWYKATRIDSSTKPLPVGSCMLHAIDAEKKLYALREGALDIAHIHYYGTLLLVAGMEMWGVEVGMSTDLLIQRHPSEDISCGPSRHGATCSFYVVGSELNARFEVLVDGTLPKGVLGAAARLFFRHKTVRGVNIGFRLD
jgi:hypothetical protein